MKLKFYLPSKRVLHRDTGNQTLVSIDLPDDLVKQTLQDNTLRGLVEIATADPTTGASSSCAFCRDAHNGCLTQCTLGGALDNVLYGTSMIPICFNVPHAAEAARGRSAIIQALQHYGNWDVHLPRHFQAITALRVYINQAIHQGRTPDVCQP